MWFVDPKIMCRNHLLGEHVECHMFTGALRKRSNLTGYLQDGMLDPRLLTERHDELVTEILRRGWRHRSPLTVPDYSYIDLRMVNINRERSLELLLSRCPQCFSRWKDEMEKGELQCIWKLG